MNLSLNEIDDLWIGIDSNNEGFGEIASYYLCPKCLNKMLEKNINNTKIEEILKKYLFWDLISLKDQTFFFGNYIKSRFI